MRNLRCRPKPSAVATCTVSGHHGDRGSTLCRLHAGTGLTDFDGAVVLTARSHRISTALTANTHDGKAATVSFAWDAPGKDA
jgi:hypothetical protein